MAKRQVKKKPEKREEDELLLSSGKNQKAEQAFLSASRTGGVAAHVWKEDKHAGGSGWETIQSDRKERAEKRFAKRALQDQDKKLRGIAGASTIKAATSPTNVSWNVLSTQDQEVKPKKSSKQRDQEDDSFQIAGSAQQKKKKIPKKKKEITQVSNTDELVKVLVSIMGNDPHPFVDAADLAARLQKVTGSSWNQKFKKRYGTLASFLSERDEFVVQENSVFLKDRFALVKGAKDEKKAKKLAKKARREGKIFDAPPIAGGKPIAKKPQSDGHKHSHSHDHNHSHSHGGHDHDHNHSHNSGSSTGFLFLLFLVLFAFIGTTIYLVTQNPALLQSLKQRLLNSKK